MTSLCDRCLHEINGVCELDVCRFYPKYKCDLVKMVQERYPDVSTSKLWNMNNGELDALVKGEQLDRRPVYLTLSEIDDILSVLPCNDVLKAKLRRAKYGTKNKK